MAQHIQASSVHELEVAAKQVHPSTSAKVAAAEDSSTRFCVLEFAVVNLTSCTCHQATYIQTESSSN